MKSYLEIYILELESENLSHYTIRNKKSTLEKFCTYINSIDNLTKANTVAYISSLTVSDTSKKQYIKIIKTFLKWLYDEGYIEKPINIKTNRVDKVVQEHITDEDIHKILKLLEKDKSFLGVRNRTIIYCFCELGLRVSELVNLNIESIDGNIVKVKAKRKERLVPLSSTKLKVQLKKYLMLRDRYARGNNALFITTSGNRLKVVSIQKMVREVGENIGINNLHPHLFRHWCIQSMLKQGCNLYYISRIVGHESLSTTETYLRSMETDEILNDMKKFTNL